MRTFILSQDKTITGAFDVVSYYATERHYYIYGYVSNASSGWMLGEYESEERAREVIQEIHETLINDYTDYEMPEK